MSSVASTGADAGVVEPPRGSRTSRAVKSVVGIALAVALLAWALPHFAKTSWADVWRVLSAVPLPTLLGLFGLMLGGLWLYTFTFTGSLPYLAPHKALIVNV